MAWSRLEITSRFKFPIKIDISLTSRGVNKGRCVCRLCGCRYRGLFGTALAGYEDADAFDHLCRRACALGEKDIGVKRAVEGVDGPGDDHRGKTRVELLGATDQFVTVHLRHQEIAENQVEGAGKRSLENFKRLLRCSYGDDAVTSGFEKEGADREDLFVIVYAENRLLGAHAVSLLPDATLWWLAADGPVRRVCWLAVRTGLGVSKDCPVARPDVALRRVMGLLLRKNRDWKSEALPSAPLRDQRHLSDELCCRTAGCERGPMPAQVARGSRRHEINLLRIQ